MTIDYEKLKSMEGITLGGGKFIKYPECKAGDILVLGKYLGTVENKYNKDKPNFKFENEGKKQVILPASGQLNYSMEDLEVGSLVRITYLGKEVMSKGTFKGKEANSFNVELLSEATEKQVSLPIKENTKAPQTNALDNLE